MCEPIALAATGLTIVEHQRLTIARYDELRAWGLVRYVMPVLQGFAASDYLSHLEQYGDRLAQGAWVGVGSVCKRNSTDPNAVRRVLSAIKAARPDLQLHGFGLKITVLRDPVTLSLLHSSDSMAWSYRARIEGGSGNDWRFAMQMVRQVEAL